MSAELTTPSLHHFARSSQTPHINYKPVLHVALQHPFVSLVNLIDRNHLHITGDPVLGTEIEHLLRLWNSTDERAHQIASSPDQRKWRHRHFGRHAHHSQGSVSLQQVEINIHIVAGR